MDHLLRQKSEADPAIRQFIAMVKMQHNALIHESMTDAGGEFKSEGLTSGKRGLVLEKPRLL